MQKKIESAIILALLELSAQIGQKGNDITQEVGLTTQQWLILLYIQGDPNIPFLEKHQNQDGEILASQIADALNVSRPNITNLLNVLIKKGFVLQVHDNKDKRRKKLIITDEGSKALEKLEPIRQVMSYSFFEKFSEQEKQALLSLLEKGLKNAYKKESIRNEF